VLTSLLICLGPDCRLPIRQRDQMAPRTASIAAALLTWRTCRLSLFNHGLDNQRDDRTGFQKKGKCGMAFGYVKFFDHGRGFGFIAPDKGGRKIFVCSKWTTSLRRDGDKVAFDLVQDERKPGRVRADNVTRVTHRVR
jgi:cold shock protein